jgi:predicted transcriptional regulator
MDDRQAGLSNLDVVALTADIASSFVSGNQLSVGELPALMRQIHEALSVVAARKSEMRPQILEPAVPIKNSVKPNYIVCLEDGKKFKSLKRHLRSSFNMTPEEYRMKWGLKYDYPMVAPTYSATRSELAKSTGLGKFRANAQTSKLTAKMGRTKKA